MGIVKIPLMSKEEYDEFISENFMSRIAFSGEYPYIAPFIYVFDGEHLYFLSTKYGRKIELLKNNPYVAVEIEEFEPDLSSYKFVTLQGQIVEVTDQDEKNRVRGMFADMIKEKGLSRKVLKALGHSPEDPLACLVKMERSYVWKLVDVVDITGIKSGE
ncbi:pyridoxamine 5'-phosphate oxidase family protein [Methanothermobacter tenebrarum]|uniref:Pyridoxamine 5'-phosphate oxidase family protein n=1 Tax=Methanothermobacter tenebrarum TaxID=680118 RepID=A0A328PCH5_9EURY|nr:pyridoxamine 5'-phosphate oxidase family protein [Methanothermobacter tenebrarum]MBC7101174.1 pyridoxamine 5'-phosphate oxidase family protein [Methanobacteriales archaeon]MBC7118344.1 pyridoxamine 5'-phosphate oxidase family protein [Methanobacteriaceae archaeon]NPV65116.1 pyridoxamine 5'-phosphate oxidase family protein [Methanobacteriaceae archaeon]RAO79490.1 pyridoxamine 5'-phosphate oxidase family protein [Methanothermobacter tenebrarum]